MSKVKSLKVIPQHSIITDGFGRIHYCDSYCFDKNTHDSIDKITSTVFKSPRWVDVLLSIRNLMVKVFGLKTGRGKKTNDSFKYSVGSRVDLFMVISRNDNEIVMGETDKHLDFRVSVMRQKQYNSTHIFVTTIVRYKNIWGRLYFMPVKPFHKLIVRAMMKRNLK